VRELNSIKENSSYQIEIKNSKFICCLFKVRDKEEVTSLLNQVKNNYKDATHYCYAYILENTKKASDDGEPGGTAGMPILNVLHSNNLMNVLAVVVRYFGGIKLGAGGLVRAYSKSVNEALNHNKIIRLKKGINVNIYFSYDKIKEIDYLLRNEIIIEKDYDQIIRYNLNVTNELLESIKNSLIKYYVIKDVYLESD